MGIALSAEKFNASRFYARTKRLREKREENQNCEQKLKYCKNCKIRDCKLEKLYWNCEIKEYE